MMNQYLQKALMSRQSAQGMSPYGQSPMMGQQQPPQQSPMMMGTSSGQMNTNSSAASAASPALSAISPAMGIISGVGSALGSLYSINPADEAMGYVSQLGETVGPYFDPYIDAGLGALDTLYDEYGNLISNPQSIYDMLASGFQASPGYQYNYDQAMNASNSAAAAGGMLGSPAHTQQSQEMAMQLANQDYYNYLDNMTSLYSMGLGGMGDINQMGYGASNQMANYMAQELMAQAYLAAMSAKFKNAQTGGLIGGIVGLGTSAVDAINPF